MSYQATLPGEPFADLWDGVRQLREAGSFARGSALMAKLCLSPALVDPSFAGDEFPAVANPEDVPGLEFFWTSARGDLFGLEVIDDAPATFHDGSGELRKYFLCSTGFRTTTPINLDGDFTVVCQGIVRETEPRKGGLFFALDGGGLSHQFGCGLLNDELSLFWRDLNPNGLTMTDLALLGASFDDYSSVAISLWREAGQVYVEVGPIKPDIDNQYLRLLQWSDWDPPREHVDGSQMSLLIQLGNEPTADPVYPVTKDIAVYSRALSSFERAAVRNGFIVRDQLDIGPAVTAPPRYQLRIFDDAA